VPVFRFEDIDFHYVCEGAGFPLLFLHGLGGELGQGRALLERTHGFRKVFMDIRAHGGTEPLGSVEKLTFEQFAADARALLDHLEIEQAVVGGISMGSGVALRLALSFPKMVQALVLVRPAWLDAASPANLEGIVTIGRLLRDHPAAEAKQMFSESALYRELERSAPAVAASALGQFDAPQARERSERLIRIPASVPFDRMEDLADVRQPTLVLATPSDPAHPLAMAETLAAAIRDSTLAVVTSKSEGLEKHFAECAGRINEFLEKHTTSLHRGRIQ